MYEASTTGFDTVTAPPEMARMVLVVGVPPARREMSCMDWLEPAASGELTLLRNRPTPVAAASVVYPDAHRAPRLAVRSYACADVFGVASPFKCAMNPLAAPAGAAE